MNKICRFFKKRCKSGFTLVEVIVSCALLAILLMGMMLFITPIVKSFNDTNRNLVAENITTCIQNYITLTTRNATNVAIFANTNEASVKANGNAIINSMKEFCETKTSTGKNAYLMKCLSLRYDTTDNRYYLNIETIDTAQHGQSG